MLVGIVKNSAMMMTTFAALAGSPPVALGHGADARPPIGIALVGGLAVSQVITLFLRPVVFLDLDKGKSEATLPAPLFKQADAD